MHNPMAMMPLAGKAALALRPPAQMPGFAAQSTDDAPVDEDEPEIVRLLVAHYRALLRLRQWSPAQRIQLTRLLDQCEARLSGSDSDAAHVARWAARERPGALHHWRECLTAIGLYAAGAQRALAVGRADAAGQALAEISVQVERARALLQAACLPPAAS